MGLRTDPGQGPPSLPCWWKRACGVRVRGCSPRSLQHVECVRRGTPKRPRTLARIPASSPRPLRPILSTSPNTFPHVVPTAGGGPPTSTKQKQLSAKQCRTTVQRTLLGVAAVVGFPPFSSWEDSTAYEHKKQTTSNYFRWGPP